MCARINDWHGNSATRTDWLEHFHNKCHECEKIIPDFETMWVYRDFRGRIDPIINVWSDFDTWYNDTISDILRRMRNDINYIFCTEKCAIKYWESIQEKCQTCGKNISSPNVITDDNGVEIWLCSNDCLIYGTSRT